MIKFFRHIRKSLLMENKTSKYFKYAIGEIILVVIGILIALSINNWNEERKDRIIENTLYRTLIISLESDLEDVTDKIAIMQSALDAQDIFIKNSFDDIKAEFDISQIGKLLINLKSSSRSFFPNYGFYNKISNNNQIDLIQSDKLQMKIIELYEQYYKRYNDLDLNIEHQNIFSLEINYFSKIRHLVSDNGWNDLTYDLIEEHYPILQDETRKINGLTYGTHDAMLNCKAQIELLLEDLRNVITE